MSTMERHNVMFERSWWAAAGMIADAMCTTPSAVMRAALTEYARKYGLTVVDGEVVLIGFGEWPRESTAEEKIQGGGESTGEGPGGTPGGGPDGSMAEEMA